MRAQHGPPPPLRPVIDADLPGRKTGRGSYECLRPRGA